MHVLYFPLITDDVTAARPDPGWARQFVRDTASGWRCVFLFRPEQKLDEFVLWEHTRTVQQRLETCVDESADTAYLLAQRIIKAMKEGGVEANDTFRFALLVSDGSKLHFYLKGFRCLLWGVPVEGSPPLRLAQEDKRNVIESRDFPSLQSRDIPQATPFIADPVVAVIDEAQPDGLLPSFAKTLEGLLVLGGPVSLHRKQRTESMRGSAATWHLWEEMSNLAAVDIRRLEAKLNQFSSRMDHVGSAEKGFSDTWRKWQPYALPGLLALNVLLLIILLFRGPGEPAALPAAPAAPAPVAPTASAPPTGALPSLLPAAPAAATAAAPTRPVAEPAARTEPAAATPEPAAAAPSTTRRIAELLDKASPTDRLHFTTPVKQFVDRRIAQYLAGGELPDKSRRTMIDVATQLLTNRRCGADGPTVRVDGAVGAQTLERVRRCARNGYPEFEGLVAAYEDPALRRSPEELEKKLVDVLGQD